MKHQDALRISQDPSYQQLVKVRSRLGWMLTLLIVAIYYGFIYLVAFRKDLLAQPLAAGVTTYSIPAGLGVIFITIILTGLYVRRANSEFDALTQKIVKEHA